MIERREYTMSEILGDEEDLLKELEDREDSYICDAIAEIADNAVPIYNSDIWENVAAISDYVEDAIAEGLVGTSKPDLMQIFRAGYYQYYTSVAYENIADVAYNVFVEMVNALGEEFLQEKGVDIDELEEKMEELASEFDHNDSWDALKDLLNEWIEEQTEEE